MTTTTTTTTRTTITNDRTKGRDLTMLSRIALQQKQAQLWRVGQGPVLRVLSASAPTLSHARLYSSSNITQDASNDDLEAAPPHNPNIQMHPDGLGQKILPGGTAVWSEKRKRVVMAERDMGNFWQMKDLRLTGSKPILSNSHLIDEDEAALFPHLTVRTRDNPAEVAFPDCLLEKNRECGCSVCVYICLYMYMYKSCNDVLEHAPMNQDCSLVL